MKQKSNYGAFKRSGGSRSRNSYTDNVSVRAREKRRMVLNATLVNALICLLLPPVGIYLIWSSEKGTQPVRIAATAAACAVMYIWFMILLPTSKPAEYQLTKVTPAAVTEYASGQSE